MTNSYPIDSIIHQVKIKPDSNDICNALAWSEDGTMLAIGTNDGSLTVWNVGKENGKIRLSDNPVYSVSYDSPINVIEWAPKRILMKGLAVGLAKGTISFVDLRKDEIKVRKHVPVQSNINALEFSDRHLIVAYRNGQIITCQKPFDSNPRIIQEQLLKEEPKSISINKNSLLAIGYGNGEVGFYDLKKRGKNLIARFNPMKSKDGSIVPINPSIEAVEWLGNTLLVSPNIGNFLALSIDLEGEDFHIKQELDEVSYDNEFVISITCSPDSNILALKTINGFVHFYYSENTSRWQYLNAYKESIINQQLPYQRLNFNPRNYIIASSYDEDKAVILRLIDGERLKNKNIVDDAEAIDLAFDEVKYKGNIFFSQVKPQKAYQLEDLLSDDEFEMLNGNDLVITVLTENSTFKANQVYRIRKEPEPRIEKIEEISFGEIKDEIREEYHKLIKKLLDQRNIPLGKTEYIQRFLDSYTNIKGAQLLYNLVYQIWEPLETIIHTEAWDGRDALGYKIYARAISKFVTNPMTSPPITIGIQGSWGYGKTTLMRLIKEEFDNIGKKKETEKKGNKEETLSYSKIIKWLRDSESGEEISSANYPTVWFNAWKYEESKHIWGGLASTIIESLVNSLENEYQKAKFWFKLKADSIDFNDLRKKLYSFLFINSISSGLFGLVGLITFLFLYLFVLPEEWEWVGISGGVISILSPILQSVHSYYKKSVSKNLKAYLSEPNLINEKGNFQKIESYLRKVLKAFESKKKPVVIFIDDLDRCSPSTIVDVFEAINMFLNGEFENCYFILGIDTKNVANAIDNKYNEQSTGEHSRLDRPSIGWSYINKFIQLPFILPKLTEEISLEYGDFLLTLEENEKTNTSDEVKNTDTGVGEEKTSKVQSDEILERKSEGYGMTGENEPIKGKGKSNYSIRNDRAIKAVKRLIPRVSGSPRMIKRFLNLYRFNMYIYKAKNRKLKNDTSFTPSEIAYWSAVMIKMPKLIHWIQTGTRDIIDIDIGNIEERAKRIDAILSNIQYNYYQADDSDFGDNWQHELNEKLNIQFGDNHWLLQENAKDLLISHYTSQSSFLNAVKVGLI